MRVLESPCDESMVPMFEEIISQISRLSALDLESPAGESVVFILKSAFKVASWDLLLFEKGVPGAENLLTSLFDALISGFKAEYTEGCECLIAVIYIHAYLYMYIFIHINVYTYIYIFMYMYI
jgi:hypothetical protein